jgi:hypothetical protein
VGSPTPAAGISEILDRAPGAEAVARLLAIGVALDPHGPRSWPRNPGRRLTPVPRRPGRPWPSRSSAGADPPLASHLAAWRAALAAAWTAYRRPCDLKHAIWKTRVEDHL